MNSKPIFFEGIDRVGKTSVMKEFNKITKFQHLCFDRGPMSYAVYGELNSKDRTPLTSFKNIDKIMKNSISVYLFNSDVEAIEKRCCKTCHTDFNILEHMNCFEECVLNLKDSGHVVIELDVENLTIEGVCNLLILELEKLK